MSVFERTVRQYADAFDELRVEFHIRRLDYSVVARRGVWYTGQFAGTTGEVEDDERLAELLVNKFIWLFMRKEVGHD